MEKDQTIIDFQNLIKYLDLALESVKNSPEKIVDELKHWRCQIDINEIDESLKLISEKVKNWYEKYSKTKDILQIGLKEYDLVSKESSYILGECALIDDLYSDVINHLILCIGSEMCDAIKEGGKYHE